jgi:hypothetical protein
MAPRLGGAEYVISVNSPKGRKEELKKSTETYVQDHATFFCFLAFQRRRLLVKVDFAQL